LKVAGVKNCVKTGARNMNFLKGNILDGNLKNASSNFCEVFGFDWEFA
jgi:hypothetical protein